jgi:hypothetical protein
MRKKFIFWFGLPAFVGILLIAANGCSKKDSTVNPIAQVPEIITSAVSNVTITTAVSGGNCSDGGAPVTAKGVCWSTSHNPTTDSPKTNDSSGTGTYISRITGLTANTPYYVRAYATNRIGTGYGNEVTFTTYPNFTIGLNWGGGIVFYIDNTGYHGLIASPIDNGIDVSWGGDSTWIGGTSENIGTGQANTTAILKGCSQAGIAARICNDLIQNGYDDWFLPSLDELLEMYSHKDVIGGFDISFYWSSSEYLSPPSYAMASAVYFTNGQLYRFQKSFKFNVRAIRAF